MSYRRYRILAQHYYSSQRIAKVVIAASEQEALHSVARELENAGYYAANITEV